MKNALVIAVILFSVFTVLVQARVWTNSKGHKISADYVGISETDSSMVKLKTTNGYVINVPISTLSKEDRKYIKSQLNGANEPLNDFDSDDEDVSEDDYSDNVVVVVEGAGETLEQAKKDALRCAVEEVVGSLVDAQSRVENDELIEQILTASSAYVEKYSVLSRKIDNGVATIKIRATVVKTSLTKKLKLSEGGQTMLIDGMSLAGQATTKAESEKNGALFLANFLKNENFPYSLLDVKFIGQPIVGQKGKDITYTINWQVSVNQDRYMKFVKRLTPILGKYALKKRVVEINTHRDSYDDYYYLDYDNLEVLEKSQDYPSIHFCICTKFDKNFSSLKYECYELPNKFHIPLLYYERVLPVVSIDLYNSDSEVIKNKSVLLADRYFINGSDLLPFNLIFHINTHLCISSEKLSNKYTNPSESKLIKFYINDSNNLIALTPLPAFCSSDWKRYFYNSSITFTTTLTLSPEELELVKSTKIFVISNNSELDGAFGRMPKEIDDVPTSGTYKEESNNSNHKRSPGFGGGQF